MRVPRGLIGGVAGSVAAVAVATRAQRRAVDRAGPRPDPGWATCSAPGARAYEATFGRMLTGLYRAVAIDLRDSLAGRTGLHIVDIGAGPGGLAVVLAEQIPDARVTTVDIDTAMASLAAARMTREGLDDRVHITVGDVAALPLADHSVDLVTSSFSVHHWPHAEAGFAEVRRVLRPGGRVIIYDVPDWWGRLETHAPRLTDAAMAGGFRDVSSSQVRWPRPFAIIHRIEATN
ncbi:MAG TPA: class I SAM-dependent methyltransferase [Candidatus Limnocylindrales bacterium]|nr:class I SAM-dependent methyltransferase [Candidatus Limnocylindrales bacterium]